MCFALIVWRFAPHLQVMNYSGSKERREEQRAVVTDHVTRQSSNWKKAKYPFHIMLGNYEVACSVYIPLL